MTQNRISSEAIMGRLDESKTRWIIREKRKGDLTNRQIAESMKISVIWVKKLWARYRHAESAKITYSTRIGRPEAGLPGRREYSAVISARHKYACGAVKLEDRIRDDTGIHIPHMTIHNILAEDDYILRTPKKSRQRKWVRYERKHSNSMWHTDYKQLDDKRWFIAYMDDASRFITGFGVFEHATGYNAIAVLQEAISNHGRPASILTDHGSQFYANAGEYKQKGASEFEKELVALDIKHILARVNHPQTNGKLERFHGELQRKLGIFTESDYTKTVRITDSNPHVGDPFNTESNRDDVSRFIDWYNNIRPHMSLNEDIGETPSQAFIRKMPPKGEDIIEESMEKRCNE